MALDQSALLEVLEAADVDDRPGHRSLACS